MAHLELKDGINYELKNGIVLNTKVAIVAKSIIADNVKKEYRMDIKSYASIGAFNEGKEPLPEALPVQKIPFAANAAAGILGIGQDGSLEITQAGLNYFLSQPNPIWEGELLSNRFQIPDE